MVEIKEYYYQDVILCYNMNVFAFDAKEFRRRKSKNSTQNENIERPSGSEFFTPLGVGVSIKDSITFKRKYCEVNNKLKEQYGITDSSKFYSSRFLRDLLSYDLAARYCEDLISHMEPYIDGIHITYVILPIHKYRTMQVGGKKCGIRNVETEKFLRDLTPSFSYITAWDYLMPRLSSISGDHEIHIDAFRGKESPAWNDLIKKTKPIAFLHGDECNCYISMADIIAFVTDHRLYQRYLKLNEDGIKQIWGGSGVEISSHYIDPKRISKISWHSESLIETSHLLSRPIVYFMADTINVNNIAKLDDESFGNSEPNSPRTKMKYPEMYRSAIQYAEHLGGSFKLYDKDQDSGLIGDHDVIVYMGNDSKRLTEIYLDAYDIEIYKVKEMRKKMEEIYHCRTTLVDGTRGDDAAQGPSPMGHHDSSLKT